MHNEPTINLPAPKTAKILYVDDFSATGLSDDEVIKAALKACQEQQASKLVFASRAYHLNSPTAPAKNEGHIQLAKLQDFTLDGNGAEFMCHHISPCITIKNCQRLVLENFVIDWDYQLASAGIVEVQSDGRTAVRILDEYPLSEKTERIMAVSEYDHKNFKWEMNGQELYNPKAVEKIGHQLLYSPSFEEERKPPHGSGKLAHGTELVVRHYVYEADAVNINHPLNSDITLVNITIYQAPGHAFACYSSGRGFHIKNSRIARRPGSNNLISVTADASHFAVTEGDILIEGCDFSYQGDDSVNIHGNWMILVDDSSESEIAFTTRLFNPNNVRFEPGDKIRFCRGNTLEILGEANILSCRADFKNEIGILRVDRELPFKLKSGDCFGNISRGCPNFIIRNNYFHDHRARGMLIQASNGLIENNLIENVMAGAFFLTSDCNYWKEGFGCENLIIRKNVMRGCNQAIWERGPKGRHMACLNLLVDTQDGLSPAHVHRNIRIEENTIENTPGLAMLISSSQNVAIANNIIINSNQEPFAGTGEAIDATAKGSIMVTRSGNISLLGNTVKVQDQPPDNPIYIDERNTVNINVENSHEGIPNEQLADIIS